MLRTFRDSLEKNQKYSEFINESISKLAASIPKINTKADLVKVWKEFFKCFLSNFSFVWQKFRKFQTDGCGAISKGLFRGFGSS